MVPNNFGIIRQPGKDLIAIPLIFDMDNIEIEEIPLEWINNKYYGSSTASTLNTPSSSPYMKCASYINTPGNYDYIIAGVSGNPNVAGNIYTGSRLTDSQNLQNYAVLHENGSKGCVILDASTNVYFYFSQAIDHPMPILGVRVRS